MAWSWVVATAVVALVAVTIVGSIDVPTITGSVLAWAVVWFVLVAGYFASLAMIAQPASAMARAISFFPLTAPLAKPGRIAMGATAWWEPVLAVNLTIAAIAGLVWLSGRICTGAILHGGPTLSLRQAWQHRTASAMRPQPPKARRQAGGGQR